MPAATTKADLLAVTDREYGKLAALIAPIGEDTALHPFEDGVTIKDIIGHRAHWITLFLGWYADGQAGRTPEMPAPGYKWNQLKAYNADLREAQRGLGWDAAKALLAANHARLTAFIEGLDEAALYGGPMQGGGNDWRTGRWAEAAGPSHYRSAAKVIRGWLKSID